MSSAPGQFVSPVPVIAAIGLVVFSAVATPQSTQISVDRNWLIQKLPADEVARLELGDSSAIRWISSRSSKRDLPPPARPGSGNIGPTDVSQPAESLQRNGRCQSHFFFRGALDETRVVNACTFRCSSTCCKHRRKKSISRA